MQHIAEIVQEVLNQIADSEEATELEASKEEVTEDQEEYAFVA